MVRDELKSNNYYEDRVIEAADSAKSLTEKKCRVIADGSNVEDITRLSSFGVLYYRDLVKSMYSAGRPLEEIQKEVISLVENVCDRGDKGSVWDTFSAISLAVLFDVDKEVSNKLLERMKKSKIKDLLVDHMMNYFDPSWEIGSGTYKYMKPYRGLDAVVNCANRDEAAEILKKYLEKEWYKKHREAAWHDSHKSEHNTYLGYWSFESGAIAKIMGLDNEKLKGVQYYPYDMVGQKVVK